MKIIKSLLSLVLLFSLLLMSACGGGNKPAKNTGKTDLPDALENPNIKVFLWSDPTGSWVIDFYNAFEEKYGGKVTFEISIWNELETKYVTTMAAGSGPDVIWNQEATFMRHLSGNLLMPIDDYVDLSDPLWDKEICDQFVWKGKHYLPLGKNSQTARLVFFNKTMFERNGVKTPLEYYEEGEWNWESFAAAGREITMDTNADGKVDQWGWASWMMSLFVPSNGGAMTTFDGKTDTITNTIDSPATMEAMQFLKDGYTNNPFIMPDGNTAYQSAFTQGTVAMITEGQWIADQVIVKNKMTDEWDVVPFPVGPQNTAGTNPCSAAGWTIAQGTKNPEGAAAFCRMYTEMEQEKSDKDLQKYYSKEQVARINKAKEKPLINMFETGFGNWQSTQWNFWFEIIGPDSVSTVTAKYKPLLDRAIDETVNN